MEDEVALLQGFGDEGLVFFGGVAREGVEIIVHTFLSDNNFHTLPGDPTKKLSNILNQHLHLNNYYTINNSTDLANNLTRLKINDNHRLIHLDIKDLYVNIPIDETIHSRNLKTRFQEHIRYIKTNSPQSAYV